MFDTRDIRECDRCGSPFHPVRELQRFCSKDCHDDFYTEEKRHALALWRAQQRAGAFFGAPSTTLDGPDEEVQSEKRRA
jgi:hypothetical protein